MIELFIKYWNLSKVVRTPTIFKLIGPCEILSHGQKSEKRKLKTETPKNKDYELFKNIEKWFLTLNVAGF